MHKFEFTRNGRKYRRVNRKRAKALFLKGEEVFCWPCNMDPSHPYWGGLYSSARFYEYDPIDEDRFEKWENNARFYNCDNERGRYLSFFEELTCYVKSDEFGVAIRFGDEHDRDRYLKDPLTSRTFKPCTGNDVEFFMAEGGYVWDSRTSFYDGSLDGLDVTFTIPKDMAKEVC